MSAPEQGGLSEVEREAVCICPVDTSACVAPDDTHTFQCSQHREAVERIITARLATVPAADAGRRAAVEGLADEPDAVRDVGEAIEDAALTHLGRDLGTIHRDDIAKAAIEAVVRSLLAGRGDV